MYTGWTTTTGIKSPEKGETMAKILTLNGRNVTEILDTLSRKLSNASNYLECEEKPGTIIYTTDEEITALFWSLAAFR